MTESLLIPVLFRDLPKTADAAKPVISHPTTARIQRAAVQHRNPYRSFQMMMASIWISLDRTLYFCPSLEPYSLSIPWTFPSLVQARCPWANKENVLLLYFPYALLFLPYAIYTDKGFPTPGKNMLGKYNEIPIDGKQVSFLIPFSQPWMEVTLNISEMEADVSTASPSP